MNGCLHTWMSGCKKTWPWLEQTATSPAPTMPEATSGQDVPGRACLALMAPVQTCRTNSPLCFAFFDCPCLPGQGRLCPTVVVCVSQPFLSFHAIAWSVLQICRKMFFSCVWWYKPSCSGNSRATLSRMLTLVSKAVLWGRVRQVSPLSLFRAPETSTWQPVHVPPDGNQASEAFSSLLF